MPYFLHVFLPWGDELWKVVTIQNSFEIYFFLGLYDAKLHQLQSVNTYYKDHEINISPSNSQITEKLPQKWPKL